MSEVPLHQKTRSRRRCSSPPTPTPTASVRLFRLLLGLMVCDFARIDGFCFLVYALGFGVMLGLMVSVWDDARNDGFLLLGLMASATTGW